MQNKDEYSIVFITNNDYVRPTVVAIKSVLDTATDSGNIHFYVLGDCLSDDSINLLNGIGHKKLTIMPSEHLIAKYCNVNVDRHVSTSALLKFFIPQIFADLDRVLYLDGDIVVRGDLTELYNTDIDDVYGAVVKDTLCVLNRKYMDEVQITNEYYFNSGVMLLNLERMRADGITEKLLHYRLNVKQQFMDQDAFNAIIGHSVKFVSYRYNFLNYYLTVMSPKKLSEFFDEQLPETISEIYNSCVILHLGGREKPWNTTLPILTDMYLPLAHQIGWFPTVYTVRQLARQRRWLKFLHKITFGKTRQKYRSLYKAITLPTVEIKNEDI